MISPDGKLLAYVSDRSGGNEVWVGSYPDLEATRPIQVSDSGGLDPVWSRDGRELFYREGAELKVVSVVREHALSFGEPQTLFQGSFPSGANRPIYDVTPDGRFVMLMEASAESTHLIVVENWFEELRTGVSREK